MCTIYSVYTCTHSHPSPTTHHTFAHSSKNPHIYIHDRMRTYTVLFFFTCLLLQMFTLQSHKYFYTLSCKHINIFIKLFFVTAYSCTLHYSYFSFITCLCLIRSFCAILSHLLYMPCLSIVSRSYNSFVSLLDFFFCSLFAFFQFL